MAKSVLLLLVPGKKRIGLFDDDVVRAKASSNASASDDELKVKKFSATSGLE